MLALLLLSTNGWMNQMALGIEVGLGPTHIVLDGAPAPLPRKGGISQVFGPCYCSQTAGCIKMPLGMEVGLSPGDFVLDGDPASPKGAQAPIFVQCPLWPNGSMDEDATWYGSRPRPRRHCIRRGPALRERGTAAPSSF